MKNKIIHNPLLRAFSIIEVLIGIFVFSLGLVSIYAILASSLRINDYNHNTIIASNLAREQIELYRNIRDTNYKKLQIWNQMNPQTGNFSDVFLPGMYYTLENNISTGNIDVNPIVFSGDIEGKSELLGNMRKYRLCLDATDIYTYSCGVDDKSLFYRYLYITELEPGSYQLTSKVIWYKRGYHEYEIKTIVTDWRRI